MTNPTLVKDVVEMVEKKYLKDIAEDFLMEKHAEQYIDFQKWLEDLEIDDWIELMAEFQGLEQAGNLPISEDKLRAQGYIKLDSVELDSIFIKHIKDHLKEGQEVVCKICGKTAKEIITQSLPQLLKRKDRG